MSAAGKPEIVDVTALRMREATILAGIWITFLVGALGETYVVLTWSRPHRLQLAVLFALATAAGAVISMLPRERIVRSALREPFFLAWTLLDLAMLVIGTIADGGTSSPLVLVFFIPVIFSAMSYPLGSVAAVGLISVASYVAVAVAAGGSSTAFEIAFLMTLTCAAAMSAWQAQNHNRQHRALVTASRTDPLTGCLNRRGFEEHALGVIDAMHRNGHSGALLVLDLDHFKAVNDHYGHPAGDRLLNHVTETLQRAVRPVDAVGRLGGDEFSVLFAGASREEADAAAARIAAALALHAPASLGVAIFPDDGEDLEELTRTADRRLYSSRRARATASEALRGDALLAADGEPPSPVYGKIDLWRAALDASPSAASASARRPEQMSLEGALLDQIDASVVAIDMSGTVLSWNSGAEALYGWGREEAIARNIRELVVPEDTKPVEKLASDVIRDGRWDGEVRVHRKDGSLFTAYVRNRLILDDAGAPGAIVGVAVDIPERKRHEQQQERDVERLATINRVEAALAEERFILYAQPIVDLQSGRTVQHELLLRMRESDGRIVPPGEFLPVAEQYALIGEIDWWALKQAAELAGAGSPVQVNVSARSVVDPDVLEHIERCIKDSAVAPGMLVFEITETAIIEDEQAARVFAERLRALGCKIALDDFGTGYGTLTYLKQIPLDYLKLDIEFVRDVVINDASRHVVQAVVSLARDFNLETVAEGVEDAEALALLRRLGVDRAQGYHLARPAPFDRRPGDTSPPVRVAAASRHASSRRPSAPAATV